MPKVLEVAFQPALNSRPGVQYQFYKLNYINSAIFYSIAMEFREKSIILNKELSELDKFTLDYITVLKTHTPYVIISGYVAILLGRARVSEDIDIIIPKISREKFCSLHDDLAKNGFYCLNAENIDEIYSYLHDKIAVRYAKINTVIPNVELKFVKNRIDEITLSNSITAILGKHHIIISSLGLQIAFKEKVLGSPKDIEDARHIRAVASGHINESEINEYKRML